MPCCVLVNQSSCKWVCSISELSQDLKSDLTKAPQTSLLWVKIGEIIESRILHASEGLISFRSLCRLKLQNASVTHDKISISTSSLGDGFPEEIVSRMS